MAFRFEPERKETASLLSIEAQPLLFASFTSHSDSFDSRSGLLDVSACSSASISRRHSKPARALATVRSLAAVVVPLPVDCGSLASFERPLTISAIGSRHHTCDLLPLLLRRAHEDASWLIGGYRSLFVRSFVFRGATSLASTTSDSVRRMRRQ